MPLGIPSIMYHRVISSSKELGRYDLGEQPYIIDQSTFLRQMEILTENGYRGRSLGDIEIEGIKKGDVLLSFDDGSASDVEIVLPILKQYGHRAEFFITTNWIGRKGFLSPFQILELANAGMGVGSHGMTHRFLSDLSSEVVIEELKNSQQELEMILNRPVVSMSFPGGRFPVNMANVWEAGYRWVGTSKVGLVRKSSTGLFPRIAMRRNTDMKCFQKIFLTNFIYYCKETTRSFLLDTAKRMVGNSFYEELRNMTMKNRIL